MCLTVRFSRSTLSACHINFRVILTGFPSCSLLRLNVVEIRVILCFKPTSKSRQYEDEPDRLKGVVEYRKGEVPCFGRDRTFVDPKSYPIAYREIQSADARGEFAIVGHLPPDFREKMIAAVSAKIEWRKVQKQEFLTWFK